MNAYAKEENGRNDPAARGLLGKWPAVLGADIFDGIGADDAEAMLRCLGAEELELRRGEAAGGAGFGRLGIVASGSIHIERTDIFGNRTIIATLGPGQSFGAAAAMAALSGSRAPNPPAAVAAEPSAVITLDISRAVSTCRRACAFHARMIRNMLGVLARRSIMLERRIEVLSSRTTREKVLAFLRAAALDAGSPRFKVPMTRDELADSLAVNRSAMCAEMSRMKRDGLIEYKRDSFELLNGE